jgi:hypothetical protein
MATNDGHLGAPGSGWSAQRQWRLLGTVAALIAIGILVSLLAGRSFGQRGSGEAAPSPPAGTFRATLQQLKTLTIEPVALHQFVSQQITEGKIALNADRPAGLARRLPSPP